MSFEIDAHELQQALTEGADIVLLDVREGWEHALVRLPEAVHIPMGQLQSRLGELDPERPHVVYCHHGIRSLHAVMALAQHGFKSIRSLRGGIDRWSELVDPSLPRY